MTRRKVMLRASDSNKNNEDVLLARTIRRKTAYVYMYIQERPLMQSIKGRRLIVNLLDQSFCAHCVVI